MNDWQTWRKYQRTDLLARRKAVCRTDLSHWSAAITTSLQQGFPVLQKNKIGFYWPIHGEYDPRPAMHYFWEQGATLALPEVINKHSPLDFRQWWQLAPMKKGAYGIPVPDNTDLVSIDALIIPMLGFDQQGYRLGYGSGYFDRTLAAKRPRPLVIGIAFEMLRLDSIHPQPHDIPMDFIITEVGIYQLIDKKLALISIEESAAKNSLK
jgi:5,10-methenyltetrahydrofolate synthetase